MAFARRNGQRFTANVWPGFVDAMTALLLVLMFVLSIFMIVQFILSETISDQDAELTDLGAQVAGLSRALGLEQQRAAGLEDDVTDLDGERQRQATLIATLTSIGEDLSARVASFEEQVASLIATRDRLATDLSETEGNLTRTVDEREALQLALASARDEIDAEAEAARLAAARAEAVEAMVAEMQAAAEG
ncbi:MAG: peptidoglycan-binding protein, partial [Jannaschia sp.]